jgi:orotidine-5'-phosphate decarboxylase
MQRWIWVSTKKFMFNKAIIDATYEHVACFKVQIAYYEALGLNGFKSHAETFDIFEGKGLLQRGNQEGDIAATAQNMQRLIRR